MRIFLDAHKIALAHLSQQIGRHLHFVRTAGPLFKKKRIETEIEHFGVAQSIDLHGTFLFIGTSQGLAEDLSGAETVDGEQVAVLAVKG